MSPHDIEYYRERALTERALAKAAERQNVAEIHEELAKQYEALAEHPELLGPVSLSEHWSVGKGTKKALRVDEGLVVLR